LRDPSPYQPRRQPAACHRRKCDEYGGVRKELQPASHDRLEHGLRVGRRTADQLENFRSRSLLLQRFVALAPNLRDVRVLRSGGPNACAFRRTAP